MSETRQKTVNSRSASDRLKGRSIIVTGAGSGIGAGIAADLAANGANVVVADINEGAAQEVAEKIVSSTGGAAIAVRVDVTDRASIQALVAKTVECFGRLDVMFNNAPSRNVGTQEAAILWRPSKVRDLDALSLSSFSPCTGRGGSETPIHAARPME